MPMPSLRPCWTHLLPCQLRILIFSRILIFIRILILILLQSLKMLLGTLPPIKLLLFLKKCLLGWRQLLKPILLNFLLFLNLMLMLMLMLLGF